MQNEALAFRHHRSCAGDLDYARRGVSLYRDGRDKPGQDEKSPSQRFSRLAIPDQLMLSGMTFLSISSRLRLVQPLRHER
ncbi:MAG: hypothetical protein ACJ8DB_15945, partial [Microvirga sp.]